MSFDPFWERDAMRKSFHSDEKFTAMLKWNEAGLAEAE